MTTSRVLLVGVAFLATAPACTRPDAAPDGDRAGDAAADAGTDLVSGLERPEGLPSAEVDRLVFALPWSAPPVHRRPDTPTAPAPVTSLGWEEHEGWVRLVVELGEGGFPGYDIDRTDEPEGCGSSGPDSAPLGRLRVRLHTQSPESLVPGARGAPDLAGVSAACREGERLDVYLAADTTSRVRVFELRRPWSLLIDVGRPGASGRE